MDVETVTSPSYVEHAIQFLISNSDVSIKNTLKFNANIREHLMNLRTELEKIRDECKRRYEENLEKIQALKSNKHDVRKLTRYYNFYSTGQPFFKTKGGFGAKPNADYMHRKKNLRELFPMDIFNTNMWSSNDKALLLFGLKQQIVLHLIINKQINAKINSKTNYKQPIANLCALVEGATTFKIDWEKISFDVLKDRHSISECICMWNSCLHPNIRRAPWSSAEDTALMKSAVQYNFQNWNAIAKALPNRSTFQCFLRYEIALSDSSRIKNTKWTKEEDDLMIKLIDKYRVGQTIPWIKIAEFMPNRNQTQVYQRWCFTVRPDIKRGRFTKEEDCILMAALLQYGDQISDLPPNILPGRTMQQVRHRYNNVLKHAGKLSDWTMEEDQELMRLTGEKGLDQWSEIAKVIGNHTRQSCRQRYLTLKKYLDKNPKNTVENAPRKKRNREGHVSADNWFEYYVTELNSDAKTGEVMNRKSKAADNKFYEKLTKIKQIYFDFFKTSYYYEYGTSSNHTISLNTGIFLINFLNYRSKSIDDISTDTYSHLSESEKSLIGFNGNIKVKENKNIQFVPPNLSTLLLARGLCLEFNPQRIVDQKVGRRRRKIEQTSPACTLFKYRLAALITLPLLLSRLQYKVIQRPNVDGENLDEIETETITDDDPIQHNYIEIKTQLDDSFKCRINLLSDNNAISEVAHGTGATSSSKPSQSVMKKTMSVGVEQYPPVKKIKVEKIKK